MSRKDQRLILSKGKKLKSRRVKIPKVSFFLPLSQGPTTEKTEIPKIYGEDRIVLQVRDPWCLHAYWELTDEKIDQKRNELMSRQQQIQKWVLRLYLKMGSSDIDIHEQANHWYLQVEDDNSYKVEIGVLATDGSFHSLARSNSVRTPRVGMSNAIDKEWSCSGEEYWKIFALSGGFAVGCSSLENHEIFRDRMKESARRLL